MTRLPLLLILLSTPALACASVGGLPDPACSPGAIDPAVTQENIHETICVPGYSKGVRPPVSVTGPMKRQSIMDYEYADTNPSHYEEDHLVSLKNGGAPADPRNLWAEPEHVMVNGEDLGFHTKDKVENEIHREICSGVLTLEEGQQILAHNWATCYHKMLAKQICKP